MKKHIILMGLLAVIFVGCATPYQKYDDTFLIGTKTGYTDSQIDEDHFSVSFIGNGNTSYDTTYSYALRRAAEVASQHGFPFFEVQNRVNNSRTETYYDGLIWHTVVLPGITLQIKGVYYPSAESYKSK
jgi:hypothetical protein